MKSAVRRKYEEPEGKTTVTGSCTLNGW